MNNEPSVLGMVVFFWIMISFFGFLMMGVGFSTGEFLKYRIVRDYLGWIEYNWQAWLAALFIAPLFIPVCVVYYTLKYIFLILNGVIVYFTGRVTTLKDIEEERKEPAGWSYFEDIIWVNKDTIKVNVVDKYGEHVKMFRLTDGFIEDVSEKGER